MPGTQPNFGAPVLTSAAGIVLDKYVTISHISLKWGERNIESDDGPPLN
jgi:hypothetical protein